MLFRQLREHYQKRDRLRLVLDYRKKYLDLLLHGGEEEVPLSSAWGVCLGRIFRAFPIGLVQTPRMKTFLLTAAQQEIEILLPIIQHQPQPVALLVVLAQTPEKNRLRVRQDRNMSIPLTDPNGA